MQQGNMLSNPNGEKSLPDGSARELYVGDIIRAAIADNMQVNHVKFEDGNSLDIGTPEDLKNYMKRNL